MKTGTVALLVPAALLLAVAGLAAMAFLGGRADLPVEAGYGATPALPPPVTGPVPTLGLARAIGWPPGERPSVPEGLAVTAFATGLQHPRWLYRLPNGDILVAESNAPEDSRHCKAAVRVVGGWVMGYTGAGVTSADRITLLRDADGDGVAEGQHAFLTGLYSPFGMVLYGDHLYVANADAVVRFPYDRGETAIAAAGEHVVDLPSELNHHWTKNLIAGDRDGTLLVTVGSNSNVGECGRDAEVDRAAILELDLESRRLQAFATGLRNPNGLARHPLSGALWTSVNERDELGSDLVPDYVTSVERGDHFGWPHVYYGDVVDRRVDTAAWPAPGGPVRRPDYAVGAHSAALGIAFTHDSSLPVPWQSGLAVALHGSWNRRPPSGYRVIYIPFADGRPAGMPRDLASGFLGPDGAARGRPVGLVVDGQGGLLVADDVGNIVWRIAATAP